MNLVLGGEILIVQLPIFVVHAESPPQHRPSVLPWRPGESDTGIDVAVILLAEAGADAAESLRAAGGKVEGVGLPVLLAEEVEDGIAQTQVQDEVGPPLILVLRVEEVIVLAKVVDRQCAGKGGFLSCVLC